MINVTMLRMINKFLLDQKYFTSASNSTAIVVEKKASPSRLLYYIASYRYIQ